MIVSKHDLFDCLGRIRTVEKPSRRSDNVRYELGVLMGMKQISPSA